MSDAKKHLKAKNRDQKIRKRRKAASIQSEKELFSPTSFQRSRKANKVFWGPNQKKNFEVMIFKVRDR